MLPLDEISCFTKEQEDRYYCKLVRKCSSDSGALFVRQHCTYHSASAAEAKKRRVKPSVRCACEARNLCLFFFEADNVLRRGPMARLKRMDDAVSSCRSPDVAVWKLLNNHRC
ncbi:uncharacterized protein BYT42DRAFT_545865 [Radiomyces spectabilis]|uniref:uncharacterized protein n=1 Tax=Radiomyces spectabilis TaxID=64574 RepID=UPI00221FCB6C|nr:uncharacterized protein BYT42DRAFT_545865 [Radiomyces spectabilis]KAI8379529.1 hypothetical protein BYT42DRAFT_545865 [Radiomyces spectabilis]